VNHAASVEVNNARRVAPSASYRFGDYYDGTRTGITAGGRVRMNQFLAATVSVSRDDITLADGTPFSTNLASLRIDTSFSTRMFLNAFIQ
jgi:hypothetical protein